MSRPKINGGPCSREDCDDPTIGRGLCKRHYQQQWRAEQKEQSRQPKAVPADHVAAVPAEMHGKHATYCGPYNCRCKPCKEAHNLELRQYRIRTKFGPILVSAASTRHRLKQLHKDGWSMKSVGAAAGLSEQGLKCVLTGQSLKVSVRVQDAIGGLMLSDLMAVNVGTLPSEQYRQMVEELLAAGFTRMQIREAIRISDWFNKPRKRIRPATAERIQRLHDQEWRNNTNNFRRHCKCIKVTEPETNRNTDLQRQLRERRRSA